MTDSEWQLKGEQSLELHPELVEVLRSSTETLGDKLSQISPEVVLQLTVRAARDAREDDLAELPFTGKGGGFFNVHFQKAGDGFVNVFGNEPTGVAPPPPPPPGDDDDDDDDRL